MQVFDSTNLYVGISCGTVDIICYLGLSIDVLHLGIQYIMWQVIASTAQQNDKTYHQVYPS